MSSVPIVCCTHCVLSAKVPEGKNIYLVYKMRGEADGGVGCLGSSKAELRTVKPSILLPPSLPQQGSLSFTKCTPSSPDTYLDREARGALSHEVRRACLGPSLGVSFWSPGSHSGILGQDVSVHGTYSMHALKTLIKYAEVQSLPQSSHEVSVCAWGCQGLSSLRAPQA